jgi:hypothetical protein
MPHKDPEARQNPWDNELIVADLRLIDERGLSSSEMARWLNEKYGTRFSRNAIIGKRSRLGMLRDVVRMQKVVVKVSKPKPPKETPLKPTAQATASSDRVRRLLMEVVVEEVNPDLISLHPRTIMDPLFGGCRWPLGLTEDGSRLHCCHPDGNLREYCPGHKRVAFQASRSPSQIAHDAKLRNASQRAFAEKQLLSRVNIR